MPITDYYVTTDAMGSVMAVLDEAGNVLERRSYDAFGEATYMLPDGTVVPDSPTGVDIGFQGQLMDQLTGMYQMGFRWYSPILGRWVSRDPIGLDGGLNLVAFVSNNSNVYTDPWGMGAVSPPRKSYLETLKEGCVKCDRDIFIENMHNNFEAVTIRGQCDIPMFRNLPSPPAKPRFKLQPEQLTFLDIFSLEFDWWGYYGGPGHTNGRADRGSITPPWKVGPPYGPPPMDAEDSCYLTHDIETKRCAEYANSQDVFGCLFLADLKLASCINDLDQNCRRRFTTYVFAFKAELDFVGSAGAGWVSAVRKWVSSL